MFPYTAASSIHQCHLPAIYDRGYELTIHQHKISINKIMSACFLPGDFHHSQSLFNQLPSSFDLPGSFFIISAFDFQS
jgi:hypothetical protein